MEEISNPAIEKLLNLAKNKPFITWDEATDVLGQDFVNSSEMESVLKLLNEHNIQLIETDIIGTDDDSPVDDVVEDEPVHEESSINSYQSSNDVAEYREFDSWDFAPGMHVKETTYKNGDIEHYYDDGSYDYYDIIIQNKYMIT